MGTAIRDSSKNHDPQQGKRESPKAINGSVTRLSSAKKVKGVTKQHHGEAKSTALVLRPCEVWIDAWRSLTRPCTRSMNRSLTQGQDSLLEHSGETPSFLRGSHINDSTSSLKDPRAMKMNNRGKISKVTRFAYYKSSWVKNKDMVTNMAQM